MAWAVFLVLFSIMLGAAVVAINTHPRDNEPKRDETPVRAFFLRISQGAIPALFVSVKAQSFDLKGFQVRVICPADGTGEVVAEVNGEYVAMNTAARGWAASREFWVVLEKGFAPIIDFGYPNNVPKRLKALEPHVDAIIKAGIGMCALASPPAQSAFRALRAAEEGFAANARKLGISGR